jgi:hypothetical protein
MSNTKTVKMENIDGELTASLIVEEVHLCIILQLLNEIYSTFKLTIPVTDNQGLIAEYCKEIGLSLYCNYDNDSHVIIKENHGR